MVLSCLNVDTYISKHDLTGESVYLANNYNVYKLIFKKSYYSQVKKAILVHQATWLILIGLSFVTSGDSFIISFCFCSWAKEHVAET